MPTIALTVTALAAVAWIYLIAGHAFFWRTDQRLPPTAPGLPPGPDAWPSVVAVVPARNEAAILPRTLPTLLAQEYPGSLCVIVVDDDSADQTARVARELGLASARASGQPGRKREVVRVVSALPAPPGWAGKVWAMEQGLRQAGDPDYVLFTDADIAYAPGAIRALVGAARTSGRTLVSQMALLRTETAAERLLIPAFVYFFATLYPFRRVNSARSRAAAAAGGCMLVRLAALRAAGGLEPIRGARIDDVALGRLLKRTGAPGTCWLGFTTAVRSLRPYAAWSDIWDMVARSAYTQLRYSPAALAGTLIGLTWLYLLPVVAGLAGVGGVLAAPATRAVPGDLLLAAIGLGAWALMSLSFLPVLRLAGLSPLRALTLPAAAALYAAMTFSSAWRYHTGRGGEWKGRTIPPGRR